MLDGFMGFHRIRPRKGAGFKKNIASHVRRPSPRHANVRPAVESGATLRFAAADVQKPALCLVLPVWKTRGRILAVWATGSRDVTAV
jgi:hypothetical protein